LDLPYTGSGVAACALCMDKVAAKHEIRAAGVPTPDWAAFNATAFRELGAADTLEEIEDRLGFPLVVKPASQGSSLGVEFASARGGGRRAWMGHSSCEARGLLGRSGRGRNWPAAWSAGGRRPWSKRSPGGRASSTSRPATRSAAPSTSAPPSSATIKPCISG